jgi:hypothetical protein
MATAKNWRGFVSKTAALPVLVAQPARAKGAAARSWLLLSAERTDVIGDGPAEARKTALNVDALSPAVFAGSWSVVGAASDLTIARKAGKLSMTVAVEGAAAAIQRTDAFGLRFRWRVQRAAEPRRSLDALDEGGLADSYAEAVKACWRTARGLEGSVCAERPLEKRGSPAGAVRRALDELATEQPKKPRKRAAA